MSGSGATWTIEEPHPTPDPPRDDAALSLLATIGRTGWSRLASHVRPTDETPSAIQRQNQRSITWLRERDLIALETVAWLERNVMQAVRLTPAGRRHLRQAQLPVVRGEMETLRDRLGHTIREHHAQIVLAADLARRRGYASAPCVVVPFCRVLADLKLERRNETLWVSIESGWDRPGHPADRWHRLAQSQAYLPQIAPTDGRLEAIMAEAQKWVYLIRGTSLESLRERRGHPGLSLWTRSFSRFEEHAHLTRKAFCPPDFDLWIQGHRRARAWGAQSQTETPRLQPDVRHAS